MKKATILEKMVIFVIALLSITTLVLGAATDMYVTTTGAGNNDGSNWTNAWNFTNFITNLTDSGEAGDRYFLEEGTYTLLGAVDSSAKDGNHTAMIDMIGVKSGTSNEPPVLSDHAFTTARPLIAAAANQFIVGDYYRLINLRFTTTHTSGINTVAATRLYNCKSTNSSGSSDRPGFRLSSSPTLLANCEGISTLGEAFQFGTSGGRGYVKNCYVHDSKTGIQQEADYFQAEFTVMDTCTNGFVATNYDDEARFSHCVFYNNTSGAVFSSSNYHAMFTNNIFDENTLAISYDYSGVEQGGVVFDYNIWDNTEDISWDAGSTEDNDAKGLNAINGDPGMTAPDDGDFTLGSGSNALDAGWQLDTNVGVTGDYESNVGVDQDDVAGGAVQDVFGWVD